MQDISNVYENQKIKIKLNRYTVKLATAEIDSENKTHKTVPLGEHEIILSSSASDFQLIAMLKRMKPELSIYRNVQVLQSERESIFLEKDLDQILNIKR